MVEPVPRHRAPRPARRLAVPRQPRHDRQLAGHRHHHPVQPTDSERLPQPRPLALQQRSHGHSRPPDRLPVQRVRINRLDRHILERVLPRRDPGRRRQQRRRLLVARPGRCLPLVERGHVQINQAGIPRPHRLPVQTPRPQRSCALAEYRDVRPLQKRIQPPTPVRRLKIDHHAPFVPIPHRETRVRPRRVPFGRLHLDHIGPKIGQQHCRLRTRDPAARVHHSHTSERTAVRHRLLVIVQAYSESSRVNSKIVEKSASGRDSASAAQTAATCSAMSPSASCSSALVAYNDTSFAISVD